MHFVSVSSQESGEFFVGKELEDFSKHEMLVIPVEQLLSAQSQASLKPGPVHLHRRTDLIADASTAMDTPSTAYSASTRRLTRRSNSVPNFQIPPAPPQPRPQRNKPQMYAAERVRAAVHADKSIRVNAAARSLGASEADSNETTKLMLEEMAARLQGSDKEIVYLKETSTSQPIGPSSTAVEEDASQSSLSQEPQANLRRLRDLETQLAELQASN